MCDYGTIAALAVSAVVSAAGSYASAQQGTAVNKAQAAATNEATAQRATLYNEQNQKQQDLEQQARDAWSSSLNKVADTGPQTVQQDQAKRTASYMAPVLANQTLSPDVMPGQSSAPKVIQDQQSKSLGDALDRAKSNATALGTMGGFGDFINNTNTDIGRTGQQVALANNFRRGDLTAANAADSAINATQQAGMVAAKNKGRTWGELGSLLSGVGSLGAAYAGSRKTGTTPTGYTGTGTTADAANSSMNWQG